MCFVTAKTVILVGVPVFKKSRPLSHCSVALWLPSEPCAVCSHCLLCETAFGGCTRMRFGASASSWGGRGGGEQGRTLCEMGRSLSNTTQLFPLTPSFWGRWRSLPPNCVVKAATPGALEEMHKRGFLPGGILGNTTLISHVIVLMSLHLWGLPPKARKVWENYHIL